MKQRRGYIGLRTFSPAEIAHLVEERVQYFVSGELSAHGVLRLEGAGCVH
jgi:hypothetical protein